MSEDADFNPGVWSGHDFSAARRVYDVHVDRSYGDAVAAGVTLDDVLPPSIETQSESPLVVSTDETSSMGEWTALIFEKLGYLDIEVRSYLGPTAEICFAAIGDARNGEDYPNQFRPFGTGTILTQRLQELKQERKGGGNGGETYELGALYAARNIHMPNAQRPIMIFIADEAPFDSISVEHARRYAKVSLEDPISTVDVFAELKRKFEVFVILKPYGRHSLEEHDAETRGYYQRWERLLGEDHIVLLDNPRRVVDVIFGILASVTGRVNYFRDEIEGRQRPDQVQQVYRSLKTVMAIDAGSQDKSPRHSGKSVMIADE